MATPRMDITSFVGKLLEQDDVDALREGVRVLAQAVMETEVSSQIGAAPYERSTERLAYRNGYRTRRWDTRVGTIELKIPKVTAGAYFPSLLEPRRRAEKALHAVIVEAYVKGVSTRKVDDHARAVGIKGVRLVISDAHEGLRQAIAKVLHEASWQRCRVHFMRNLLSTVPKQAQDAVAAIVRSIFSQPDHASAMAQLQEVARMLSDRF